MEKINQVFCLFEQSGTFKNCFKEMGIQAADYDIENQFGETDYQLDLFKEIESGWNGQPSIFDKMGNDSLCIAFFPCTYFSALSQIHFHYNNRCYNNLNTKWKTVKILERSKKREKYFELAVKLISIMEIRGIKGIMENPWNEQTYLKGNFPITPQFIDKDRTRRGDFYKKPTAYWFVNFIPGNGFTTTKRQKGKLISRTKKGIERSLISKEYAKNFICDQILKTSPQRDYKQLLLFE